MNFTSILLFFFCITLSSEKPTDSLSPSLLTPEEQPVQRLSPPCDCEYEVVTQNLIPSTLSIISGGNIVKSFTGVGTHSDTYQLGANYNYSYYIAAQGRMQAGIKVRCCGLPIQGDVVNVSPINLYLFDYSTVGCANEGDPPCLVQ